MRTLGRYSFGTGDRFGKEGKAQLQALLKVWQEGVEVTPVWNKSHREHETVGSRPESVREEADKAVRALNFKGAYFVDADHIDQKTVDPYLLVSDFFTIDVANCIGIKAPEKEEQEFFTFFEAYMGEVEIPGLKRKMQISKMHLREMLDTFLLAAKKAGEVYSYIRSKKATDFHVEVSIDEVEKPQSPVELFCILAALSFYQVPVNTIAPKFAGEFNKGVDYRGDLGQFEKEFEEDLLVLRYAVQEFNFPHNLKLSVHSGSDKFSIYPIIKKLIKKHNSGLHLKTAGTTWLEEITVIAESGEDGFDFAMLIYEEALERFDELTSPYPDVLDIDRSGLPAPEKVRKEGGANMAKALRHNEEEGLYDPNLRQLMHCAYKIAAEREEQFYNLLEKYREPIETAVTYNLYEKHLVPLFLGNGPG